MAGLSNLQKLGRPRKVNGKGANKHCYYGGCVSDSRKLHPRSETTTTRPNATKPQYFFVNFPKPCLEFRKGNITGSDHVDNCSSCAKCLKWIKCCKRKDGLEHVKKDTYICSRHFVGKNGPTEDYPDPANAYKGVKKLKLGEEPSVRCPVPIKEEICDDTEGFILPDSQPQVTNEPIQIPPQVKQEADFEGTATTEINNVEDSKETTIINSEEEVRGTIEIHNVVSLAPILVQPICTFVLTEDTITQPWTYHIHKLRDLGLDEWQIGIDNVIYNCSIICNAIVEKTVTINRESGFYSVRIFDRNVDDHDLCTSLRQRISHVASDGDLRNVLRTVKSWKICKGNFEQVYKDNLHVSSDKMEYCRWGDTVRAKECLYMNFEKRCHHCSQHRHVISRRLVRRQADGGNKRLKSLDRHELLKLAKYQKLKLRLCNQKLQRLRKRLESGESISRNDSDALADALFKNLDSEKDSCVLLMLKEQLKALQCNPSKTMKWNPIILRWCMHVYRKSYAAYEAIRDSGYLKLPSNKTLSRHKLRFNHQPEFLESVSEEDTVQLSGLEALASSSP